MPDAAGPGRRRGLRRSSPIRRHAGGGFGGEGAGQVLDALGGTFEDLGRAALGFPGLVGLALAELADGLLHGAGGLVFEQVGGLGGRAAGAGADGLELVAQGGELAAELDGRGFDVALGGDAVGQKADQLLADPALLAGQVEGLFLLGGIEGELGVDVGSCGRRLRPELRVSGLAFRKCLCQLLELLGGQGTGGCQLFLGGRRLAGLGRLGGGGRERAARSAAREAARAALSAAGLR